MQYVPAQQLKIGRSPSDGALRRIWRQVLGPKAEPFDAGLLGMGIGARRLMRLLAAIESSTGVRLSPNQALQLDTFDAVADAVRAGAGPQRSPLILLKPGRGGSPLYVVCGGGGFILELVTLARRIEHDGPIWGLHLPGLDGQEGALESIEQMAAYYMRHILSRHRSGPYHLIGYSFGGLVALEMARVIRAAHLPLGLLGLLESNLHERHWPIRGVIQYSARRATIHVKALFSMAPGQAAERIARLSRSVYAKAMGRLRPEASASRPDTVERSAFYIGGLPEPLQQVRDKSIAAFEAYGPAPLDCPVVLVKSREGEPHFCDPVLTWTPLLPHLDVVIVPGAHRTMIRPPFCDVLAAELSRRLRQADVRH